jgi:hypothetical protein
MAAERITLPASVASTGPDAKELVVAFRVSQRMSDIAIGVQETDSEIAVHVEATLTAPSDASCGWFPYLAHTSAVVALERALGTRRVQARRALAFF